MASLENRLDAAGIARRRLQARTRRRETLVGLAFLSPWLIGFVVFLLGPMIASFYLSFTQYKVVRPPVWLGIDNYARMFGDKLFYHSLKVTLTYTVMSVPIGIVAALAIATLLNQTVVASGVFRTIFYLPSVVSGVSVAIVFAWIFNYRFGIINYFLSLVGIVGPNWLGHPRFALWAFVLMSLWGIGGTVVIFLASLQGVPQALYEAAEIDGANPWRRFTHITLPMISPSILFVLIMGVIGTFQTFTTAYIMTAGGPSNATLFYLLYLYKNAFSWFEMGYASALAWFLFLIILVCTLALLKSSASWVHYEGSARR
ncbi:MAG: carbohydrate ABC transporter permease [Anaerolineae bacterium]